MRFYDILITNASGTTVQHFSSYVNGQSDPGALMCEIDVLIGPQHTPLGNSYVRLWGISLQTIGQASDLNGLNITVQGGMRPGLPLANTQQPPGILFQGQIFQAFGNWQGTTQTLDIYVIPAPPTQNAPGNFTFQWLKGQPMATAIKATLARALPGYTANVNISSNLVFAENVTGTYDTPQQFAAMLNAYSQSIISGPNYAGISLVLNQNTVTVFDGTAAAPLTVKLQFTDLIGQATWYAPQQVQVKTVMRADLSVGDAVTLPPGQVSTQAASLSQFRQGSVFQGTYMVQQVRHVGNSRAPDANAWCSIFNLVLLPSSASNG